MNPQRRKMSIYTGFFIPFLLFLLITFWVVAATILLLSGEAIFILPLLFIEFALCIVVIIPNAHASMPEIFSSISCCLCLALFSYLSATDPPATRPFFPIFCLFIALYMLLSSWRQRYFFSTLHVCVWLSCIAVAFFFGLWPVGLIAITVSILLSITIILISPHLAHLLISATIPEKDPKPAPPAQKLDQQEVQIPQPTHDTLVPGQQYQPLLSEYDSSYGPYIQDLPRE